MPTFRATSEDCVGPDHADRDIGVAADKVVVPVRQDEFNGDARVLFAENAQGSACSTSVPIISLAVMRTVPRSSSASPEAARCNASAAIEHGLGVGNEGASSVGARPPCERVKRPDAERLFQRVHVAAHGRLREAKLPRGARKASLPDDREKGPVEFPAGRNASHTYTYTCSTGLDNSYSLMNISFSSQRNGNWRKTMASTALILGATGGFGGEMALALHRHGWQIRALNRNPKRAAKQTPDMPFVDWVKGDAMRAEDVRAAAVSADIIVHAVNPPGYRNWGTLVLPMIDNTIAAARKQGHASSSPAPSTLRSDAFPLLARNLAAKPEDAEGQASRRDGAAPARGLGRGVPVLILRAGDFFGGRNAGNNWFAQGLVKPGKALRAVSYPGPHHVGHNWAYLPDMAETVARLLMRADELSTFESFHFSGHWLEQGIEMADAIRYAARKPDLPVKRLPWFALTLLSPFVETFREMREMRYLWKKPVKLDNSKLAAFLGAEPHTPLDIAVRATLSELGCIDANVRVSRSANVTLTEGTIS